MSRVVRCKVTNRLSSGTHIRRVWRFTFCQRLVLMFEWETFWASSLRLPVMSLFAMAGVLALRSAAKWRNRPFLSSLQRLLGPGRPVWGGWDRLGRVLRGPVDVDAAGVRGEAPGEDLE